MNICVVSHRRAEGFCSKTLSFLKNCGVEIECIDVFLSDGEDLASYSEVCPQGLNFIVSGARSLGEKFNYVHEFYPEGEKVLCFEDDVSLVYLPAEGGRCKEMGEGFMQWAEDSFSKISSGGIFGITPHSNHFFMKQGYTETLKLCVANAFGFISTHDEKLKVNYSLKNDYERTILYWNKYGRTVRCNHVGVVTKNYRNGGGISAETESRAALEEEAVSYLCKRYGHLVSRNSHKKSVYPELKLRAPRSKGVVYDWEGLQAAHDQINGF